MTVRVLASKLPLGVELKRTGQWASGRKDIRDSVTHGQTSDDLAEDLTNYWHAILGVPISEGEDLYK
jgi:hypothetical protein